MQDQLIYQVVLQTDPASVKAVQEQLNAITTQAQKSAKDAQVDALAGGRVEAIQKITFANKGNVQSLIELQKQQANYKADLKVLIVQEQIQGKLTDAQAVSQQELKLSLKAASTEYGKQQRELIAISSATTGLARTYDELVAQNKSLSIQMKAVPLNDTTGKLKALQTSYKDNNDALKKFDASIGNNQRNVGNYSDALTGMGSNLSSTVGPIGGVGKSLTSLSGIIKLSPIGMLATLALTLVASLSRVQAVTDSLNVVFQGLNTVLTVVGGRLAKFGSGMVAILNRDFSKGVDLITASFTGLTDELVETYKAGSGAEKMLQDIRRSENTALVVQARLTRDIAEARLDAKNAELSTEERLAGIHKAIELSKLLAESERGLAVQRLNAAQTKLRTDTTDIEFLSAVARARADLINVDTALANSQRLLYEERTTLSRRFIEEAKEEANQRLAIERQFQESIKSIGDEFSATIEAGRRTQRSKMISDQADALDRRKRDADADLEIQKNLNSEKLALEKNLFALSFSLGQVFFGQSKALAIAQAIIDTYKGAQSAYANTPGGLVSKSIAAAVAIAQGFARVRSMRSAKPGGSSSSGSSGAGASAGAPVSVPPIAPVSVPPIVTDSVISRPNVSFASSMNPNSGSPNINIEATLDRKGLAIAVRQGEIDIKSEQITFAS